MADEDLAKLYQRQIAEKDDIISGLRKEEAKRRVKNRELSKSLEDATRERDALKTTVGELQTKVTATPAESLERVAALEGELRDIKHRGAFKEAAVAGGVRPDAVDALWTLSNYKAETPEADPETIDALVRGSKDKFSYLYQAEGQGTAPPARPPLGADRGKAPAGHTMKVTQAQLSDPEWCYKNQSQFAEAQKNGSVIFTDM